jgi:hypothetical protein
MTERRRSALGLQASQSHRCFVQGVQKVASIGLVTTSYFVCDGVYVGRLHGMIPFAGSLPLEKPLEKMMAPTGCDAE